MDDIGRLPCLIVAAPKYGGHAYSLYFVAAAFVCLGIALLPIKVHRGETLERRSYWGGTFGAALSAMVAGIPDWVGGAMFACVTVFAMALPAYFSSGTLIKIRGKVYSFHIHRSQEKAQSQKNSRSSPLLPEDYPDAYNGDVTAAKLWWLMVVATAFLVFFVAAVFNNPADRLLQVACVVFFVVMAIALGYFGDGSYGYPVARRQYVQFVVISVMSAGTFALLYLPAYALGRRWPYRHSKSLEREARPRYWEK